MVFHDIISSSFVATYSAAIFMKEKLFGTESHQQDNFNNSDDYDYMQFMGDGQNMKLKMCLYLEALFAAMEVGCAL